MSSKARGVNAYLRNVIAPLVFPNGFHEKDNQLYGDCPKCGKPNEHCSICIKDNNIVGHCFACNWVISDFIESHPEHEKVFSGYKKYLEEQAAQENGTLVREHFYTNQFGKILFRKQIFKKSNGKKDAKWATLDPDGRTFTAGTHGNIPIYHLDEIESMENDSQKWIYICEGEKDADNVRSLMASPATCLPHGAAERKIHSYWLNPFAGQRVIVMGDADPIGFEFVELLVKKLLPVALVVKKILPTDLLDLPLNEVASKKKGYDVSDYIEEVGKEAAYQKIKILSEEKPPESPSELETELPRWVIVKTSETGKESRSINEPLFCDEFQQMYKISRINGIYYSDGESVTDDYILKLIQGQIQSLFVEKTGQLVQQINKTLENACYATQPEPDDRKIYCKESTSLTLDRQGDPFPIEEEVFSLTRLPVAYKPSSVCPTFLRYLSDLFYEDDIPAIQEYIGYCLVPCTRAQAGLFIRGKGGEGKSVLRDVLMNLFGHAAIQESIDQFEGRFIIANLENRLICIDDDMQMDLLGKTGTLKKLITAKEKMQVERKNKQKYEAYIYARIIGIGNSFIGSKFDHSDGFYRRQLLIDCKPKTRSADEDDRFMSDKCISEIEGVFIWALAGLKRLMQNGYQFTISERMRKSLDNTKKDNDNTLSFFEDDNYIKFNFDWTDTITSADLFAAYAYWCKDNSETPIKRGSFQRRIGDRFKEHKGKVPGGSNGVNGYIGFVLSSDIRQRIGNKNTLESAWLDRLP